ncbi:hypothetical protein FIBSPDRAFT_899083 [Athelia psychrophila]|uniref:Uncharacterized protein n=1 Tax=Athelia psychrophila TaxID=1759441 RepID=A0A166A6F8_9AGAM|nr:hypothetical protein FIBSPDRAFT_899083 [Fibularhizoctonia sp. CBS 109695]
MSIGITTLAGHFVECLLCFVDEHFGISLGGDLEMYKPYGQFLLVDQTKHLLLWDKIKLPHEEEKQISSRVLPTISFSVDINEKTVPMPIEKCDTLLRLVQILLGPGQPSPCVIANG